MWAEDRWDRSRSRDSYGKEGEEGGDFRGAAVARRRRRAKYVGFAEPEPEGAQSLSEQHWTVGALLRLAGGRGKWKGGEEETKDQRCSF